MLLLVASWAGSSAALSLFASACGSGAAAVLRLGLSGTLGDIVPRTDTGGAVVALAPGQPAVDGNIVGGIGILAGGGANVLSGALGAAVVAPSPVGPAVDGIIVAGASGIANVATVAAPPPGDHPAVARRIVAGALTGAEFSLAEGVSLQVIIALSSLGWIYVSVIAAAAPSDLV
jgi:hypothetical protein